MIYVDDSICITTGLEEAKRNSKFARGTLIAAGLVPNVEKSNWGPSQTSVWLGIITDTHNNVFFLPKNRIESLTTSIPMYSAIFALQRPGHLLGLQGK